MLDARLRARAIALGLTALVAASCDELPRDASGTLDRVRGGVLRVGATESPPWIVRAAEGASGPEAKLVEAFASELGARVEWQWGPGEEHLEALERRELDLVAAGLTRRSMWKHRVGLSRPWVKSGTREGVLATPPGENRFLVALDRYVERHRSAAVTATGGAR